MKKITAFALIALALTSCSSAQKKAQQAQEFLHNETNLVAAQRNAVIHCAEPAICDAAWGLTKRYIEQRSDMRVTRADAVAIDTAVPADSGQAAFSATRVAKGAGATLTLFAQCRGMYGPGNARGSDYDTCAEKIIQTQNGYAAFLNPRVYRGSDGSEWPYGSPKIAVHDLAPLSLLFTPRKVANPFLAGICQPSACSRGRWAVGVASPCGGGA